MTTNDQPSASQGGARARSVLAVGYVVLDIVSFGDQIHHAAGGTAGNVAAALAWLGWDARVVARLGADPAGKLVAADLSRWGVNGHYIRFDPDVETPLVLHEVLGAGTHRFRFACPVCGRQLPRHRPPSPDQATEAFAGGTPSVVFFDRASRAALTAAEAAKAGGALVMFEPNSPGRADAVMAAAELADILKISDDRDAVSPLLSVPRPGQLQLITMGSRGVRWRRESVDWRYERAIPNAPLDAAGAGDWMTAGLLHRSGPKFTAATFKDIRLAIRFGQAIATVACGYVGARGLMNAMSSDAALTSANATLGLTRMDSPAAPSRSRDRRKSPVRGACRGCLTKRSVA